MRAASQLPGRGPLLWIWPLYLHVNQKSDDDDDDQAHYLSLCFVLRAHVVFEWVGAERDGGGGGGRKYGYMIKKGFCSFFPLTK